MTKSILTKRAFKLPVYISGHENAVTIEALTAKFDGDRLDKLIQLSASLCAQLGLTLDVESALSVFRKNIEDAHLANSGIPSETTDRILNTIEAILLKGHIGITTGMQIRIKRIFARFIIDIDKCLFGLSSHLEMIKYDLDSSEQLDYWLTSMRQEIIQQLASRYCSDHRINQGNEIHVYNFLLRDATLGFHLPSRTSAEQDAFYDLDTVADLEKQKIKKLFAQRYSALSILNWLIRHIQSLVMKQVRTICKASFNEKNSTIIVESAQDVESYNVFREYVTSVLTEVGLGIDAILSETGKAGEYQLGFNGVALPILLHLFAANYFSIEYVQEYLPKGYSWDSFIVEVNKIISSKYSVSASEKLSIFIQNLLSCEIQDLQLLALQAKKSCSLSGDATILSLLLDLSESKAATQVIQILQILLYLEDFDLVRQYINSPKSNIVTTMDLLIKGFTSLDIDYDLQLRDVASEVVASISSNQFVSVLEFVKQFHDPVTKLRLISLAACKQLSELDHETITSALNESNGKNLIDRLLDDVQLNFAAVKVEMISKLVSYVESDIAINILKKMFFGGAIRTCGEALKEWLRSSVSEEMYYSILTRIVSIDDDVNFLDKEQLIEFFLTEEIAPFVLNDGPFLVRKVFIFAQLMRYSYYAEDLLTLLSAIKNDVENNDEDSVGYYFPLYIQMLALAVCSESEHLNIFANYEIRRNNRADFLGKILGSLAIDTAHDLLIDDIIYKLSRFNEEDKVEAISIAIATSIVSTNFIKLYQVLISNRYLEEQQALIIKSITQLLAPIEFAHKRYTPKYLTEDSHEANLMSLRNLLFLILWKNNEQKIDDETEAIAYVLRKLATKEQYPLDAVFHEVINCMPEGYDVPVKEVFALILRGYLCCCNDENDDDEERRLYEQVIFKLVETKHDYMLELFIETVVNAAVESFSQESKDNDDGSFVYILAYLHRSLQQRVVSKLQQEFDALMQCDNYLDTAIASIIALIISTNSTQHLNYLQDKQYIEKFLSNEKHCNFSRQVIVCGILENGSARFLDYIYNENIVRSFGELYDDDEVIDVIVELGKNDEISRILQLLIENNRNPIALKILLAAKHKSNNIPQDLFGRLRQNACAISLKTITAIAEVSDFDNRAIILRAFLSAYGREALLDLLNIESLFDIIKPELLIDLIHSAFTNLHKSGLLVDMSCEDAPYGFDDVIYFLNNLKAKVLYVFDQFTCRKMMSDFCLLLSMKNEKVLRYILEINSGVLERILLNMMSLPAFSKIDNIFPSMSDEVARSYYENSKLQALRTPLLKQNGGIHKVLQLVPEAFQITYLLSADVIKLHGALYDANVAKLVTEKVIFAEAVQMVKALHYANHTKAAGELLLALFTKHEALLGLFFPRETDICTFGALLNTLNEINKNMEYVVLVPSFYRLLLIKNKKVRDAIFAQLDAEILSGILAKVKHQDLGAIDSIYPEMSLAAAKEYYNKIHANTFMFNNAFATEDLQNALKLVPRQYWLEFLMSWTGSGVKFLTFKILLNALPKDYLSEADKIKIINWLARLNMHANSDKWLSLAVKECWRDAYSVVQYFENDILSSMIGAQGLVGFLELFPQEDICNIFKLLIKRNINIEEKSYVKDYSKLEAKELENILSDKNLFAFLTKNRWFRGWLALMIHRIAKLESEHAVDVSKLIVMFGGVLEKMQINHYEPFFGVGYPPVFSNFHGNMSIINNGIRMRSIFDFLKKRGEVGSDKLMGFLSACARHSMTGSIIKSFADINISIELLTHLSTDQHDEYFVWLNHVGGKYRPETVDQFFSFINSTTDKQIKSYLNSVDIEELSALFADDSMPVLLKQRIDIDADSYNKEYYKLLIDGVDDEVVMALVPDMKALIAMLGILPESARNRKLLSFSENHIQQVIGDGRDLPLLFDFMDNKEKLFILMQTIPNVFSSFILSRPYDEWHANASNNNIFCDLYYFAKIKLYCADRIQGPRYTHPYGRFFGYNIEKKIAAITSLLYAIKYDTQLTKKELKCLSQGRVGALYAEYNAFLTRCKRHNSSTVCVEL